MKTETVKYDPSALSSEAQPTTQVPVVQTESRKVSGSDFLALVKFTLLIILYFLGRNAIR